MLGKGEIILPKHIQQSVNIDSLSKDRNGQYYKHNLCAFRCLAVHEGHNTSSLESRTRILFEKWVKYNRSRQTEINSDCKSFPGVTLEQIAYFEKCFEISVNIFSLNEDQSVLSVYQSKGKFSNISSRKREMKLLQLNETTVTRVLAPHNLNFRHYSIFKSRHQLFRVLARFRCTRM